jgi:hypothetical protein
MFACAALIHSRHNSCIIHDHSPRNLFLNWYVGCPLNFVLYFASTELANELYVKICIKIYNKHSLYVHMQTIKIKRRCRTAEFISKIINIRESALVKTVLITAACK